MGTNIERSPYPNEGERRLRGGGKVKRIGIELSSGRDGAKVEYQKERDEGG